MYYIVGAALLLWAVFGRSVFVPLPRALHRFGDLICLGGLLITAGLAYAPLLRGVAPSTGDHGEHLLKVLELERLLDGGRLFGWTDYELAGLPHNVQYPCLAYLVIAAIHRLLPVSLPTAYAWSLFIFLILGIVVSTYFAARLYYGRAVGVVAALFALCDPGTAFEGGHSWSMVVGVWISTVGSSLTVFGLALVPRAVRSGEPRRLAIAGVTLGIAILFHPLALVLALVAIPPMALAMLAVAPPISAATLLRSAALIAVGALATCAWWLVPHVGAHAFARPFFVTPPSAASVWSSLVDATLLHHPALWLGAAVCGLCLLARKNDGFSLFVVLCVVEICTLDTIDALTGMGLYQAGQPGWIESIQLVRLYYLIRPLCFIAAAFAMVAVSAPSTNGPQPRGWRSAILRASLALAILFWLSVPGVTIPGWPTDPSPQELGATERHELAGLLRRARALVAPDERLALFAGGSHRLVGPAALAGFKIESIGLPPATMVKNVPDFSSPEALARAGGTALLCAGACPPQLRFLPLVEQTKSFELRRLQPLPRAWIEQGPGRARVVSWGTDEIQIDVAGADQRSWLRLMLGYYPAWHDDGGAALSTFDALGAGMTTLPARNGRIVLRYVKPAAEWIGFAVSLFGLYGLAYYLHRKETARPPT